MWRSFSFTTGASYINESMDESKTNILQGTCGGGIIRKLCGSKYLAQVEEKREQQHLQLAKQYNPKKHFRKIQFSHDIHWEFLNNQLYIEFQPYQGTLLRRHNNQPSVSGRKTGQQAIHPSSGGGERKGYEGGNGIPTRTQCCCKWRTTRVCHDDDNEAALVDNNRNPVNGS